MVDGFLHQSTSYTKEQSVGTMLNWRDVESKSLFSSTPSLCGLALEPETCFLLGTMCVLLSLRVCVDFCHVVREETRAAAPPFPGRIINFRKFVRGLFFEASPKLLSQD